MTRYATIDIAKQAMNFSVAHFTIFSATERENLHGHNFQVECQLTGPLGDDGLLFDYAIVKRALKALCDELDEQTLLPARSPHLRLEEEGDYLVAVYGKERLPFLKRDVTTLPIANTTVEELSRYLLERLSGDAALMGKGVKEITLRVASSPGQRGVCTRTFDSP